MCQHRFGSRRSRFLWTAALWTSTKEKRLRRKIKSKAVLTHRTPKVSDRLGGRGQQAVKLLNVWFAKPLSKAEILERIRSDQTISEPVRKQTLVLAERSRKT